VPENYFMEARIQPYIHDCTLLLRDGTRSYQFRIFFKWHVNLPINHSIPARKRVAFRGDVMIMRVGAAGGVVNMRAGDSAMADYAAVK
jgi:hypothetical protein